MSNKNIKILIAVLTVLIGFLLIRFNLSRLTPTSTPYTEKIKSLDKTQISSIVVRKASELAELKKENNVWMVKGKKADANKIENFIGYLLPSSPPELIAQTDKRHQEFELTEVKAAKVTLDNKFTWLIGKSSGSAVYSRFEGDNAVYLLNDLSLSDLSEKAGSWYDKTILSFDQSKATNISFKEKTSQIILNKKDDKWISEKDNKEAKKEKVDSALATLSNITAQSLVEDPLKIKYSKDPDLTIKVEYDGKSETLEFYKGESDYLVKKQSDNERFIMNQFTIYSLISAPKEIL